MAKKTYSYYRESDLSGDWISRQELVSGKRGKNPKIIFTNYTWDDYLTFPLKLIKLPMKFLPKKK